jgi:hypothetical protein
MNRLAFALLLSTGLVADSARSPATAQPPPSVLGQIRGVVLEGNRPQPNLKVTLRTDVGEPVATRQTDLEGRFAFDSIAAGPYILSSVKAVSNGFSVGEASVAVEPTHAPGDDPARLRTVLAALRPCRSDSRTTQPASRRSSRRTRLRFLNEFVRKLLAGGVASAERAADSGGYVSGRQYEPGEVVPVELVGMFL